MLDVLLLFSSICTAVVVGASQTIHGYRGETLNIRCSYESGYETYSKYFCKGECKYRINKIIMVESGSPDKDERFSLTDDTTARVFTVTITDLRTEDEGQYWCAVRRSVPLPDVYSEIMLRVKDDNKTTKVSTIKTLSSFSTTELNPVSATHQTETSRTTTGKTTDQLYQTHTNLASVAGGLGSVLLVLILCSGTFIFLKKRKRQSGTALFQQNVQQNTEMPASHLNTRPNDSTVYATVFNQKPDSNPGHTHSTNQETDTAGDYYANIKSPKATQDSGTELIYETATHPQNITTDEGLIYSVIKH